MKVIDLLVELNNFNNGKTANLPKKIKMYGNVYELKKDKIDNHYYYDGNLYSLVKDLDDTCDLNHEIEIIEEDNKIEFEDIEELTCGEYEFKTKAINSLIKNQKKIIDKLNKMEENK